MQFLIVGSNWNRLTESPTNDGGEEIQMMLRGMSGYQRVITHLIFLNRVAKYLLKGLFTFKNSNVMIHLPHCNRALYTLSGVY